MDPPASHYSESKYIFTLASEIDYIYKFFRFYLSERERAQRELSFQLEEVPSTFLVRLV